MMEGKIPYTLKKSKRAKRMRIAVYCDGSIVVTAPYGLGDSFVERFVREKAEWALKKVEAFKHFKKSDVLVFDKKHYEKHKKEALSVILDRVEFFNEQLKLSYNKVNVRNQKTKWGSCSKSGNLNFNYKILFLSEKIKDYIIVHELCHLKEFNHSKKFWSLVAGVTPDYREIKKELRKYFIIQGS